LTATAAPAGTIVVAIEVPHGPMVETLLERGFIVHSIDPEQLDCFRDRFTVAGAKDDRLDSQALADSLRTDRHCFRPLRLADPTVVELREWSRMAEDLQQERMHLTNRVCDQLWRYYPQIALPDGRAPREGRYPLVAQTPILAVRRRSRNACCAPERMSP
jgi:hypothetical protein